MERRGSKRTRHAINTWVIEEDEEEIKNSDHHRGQEQEGGTLETNKRQPGEDHGAKVTLRINEIVWLLQHRQTRDYNLPKFYGDVMAWPEFYRKFKRSTEYFAIQEEDNRDRLDKALRGEARHLVRAKLHSSSHLNDILHTLENEFGGPDRINRAVVERIKRMEPLHRDLFNIEEFLAGAQDLLTLSQQLDNNEKYCRILPQLARLIPVSVSMSWRQLTQTLGRKGQLTDFVQFLCDIEEDFRNSWDNKRRRDQ